jgi:hypothetical protein
MSISVAILFIEVAEEAVSQLVVVDAPSRPLGLLR